VTLTETGPPTRPEPESSLPGSSVPGSSASAPSALAATRLTPAPPRRRRSKRWLRAAIPFAVLLAIWIWTAVAHAIEEPDLNDPGTLSPTGTGAHGSSHLADLLRSRGIGVDRVTSSTQARLAASGPAASGSAITVFVPTPDYLNPAFFAEIVNTPGVRRVVVVRPGLRTVNFANLPVFPTGGHWATKTVVPDCGSPVADAGQAAVLHTRYEFDASDRNTRLSMNCYFGAVVGVQQQATETVYVGATDPFRNDRIDEVGNEALATNLLSQNSRVIWVDVHAQEPVVRPSANLPQLRLPQYRRGDQDRTNTGYPVIDAFPSWLWASLLLALLAAALLAVARARRLGPPVAEPLAVIVPASEAVTGRGRLYQRINAREATLDTLRTAAMSRMVRVLNPFGAPPPEREFGRGGAGADQLVRQIVAHTRTPEADVREILYGSPPEHDAQLADAVARLDALVTAVLRDNPQRDNPPPDKPGGNP
jgi:hypothetical protein